MGEVPLYYQHVCIPTETVSDTNTHTPTHTTFITTNTHTRPPSLSLYLSHTHTRLLTHTLTRPHFREHVRLQSTLLLPRPSTIFFTFYQSSTNPTLLPTSCLSILFYYDYYQSSINPSMSAEASEASLFEASPACSSCFRVWGLLGFPRS